MVSFTIWCGDRSDLWYDYTVHTDVTIAAFQVGLELNSYIKSGALPFSKIECLKDLFATD